MGQNLLHKLKSVFTMRNGAVRLTQFILYTLFLGFQEKEKKNKKFDSVARTHLKTNSPIRNHDLLRICPSNHHSENSIPFLCGGRMSAVPHHFPDFLIFLHQFFPFFARNTKSPADSSEPTRLSKIKFLNVSLHITGTIP